MPELLTDGFYGGTRNPFNYIKVEQVARDVSTPWLSMDDISNQLNLFGDESQDDYLANLELAVRLTIEDYLGMAIFSTGYKVYYGTNTAGALSLDLPEDSQGGVTVTAVRYYNSANALVTLDSSTYYYDASGSKIVLATMPSDVNRQRTAPIIAEYTTAANPIASYPNIQWAGLLLLTHLYNNRSETSTANLKNIPFGIDVLLRPYKPLVF